jgi:hypothetical protein
MRKISVREPSGNSRSNPGVLVAEQREAGRAGVSQWSRNWNHNHNRNREGPGSGQRDRVGRDWRFLQEGRAVSRIEAPDAEVTKGHINFSRNL